MSKHDVTEAASADLGQFEAPELALIGETGEVILGIPTYGYDHRGLTEPNFEFESDD